MAISLSRRHISFVQLEWGLSVEDPLEYSCAVEALMAAWIGGKLPASANEIAVPYAHQASYSCPRTEKSCLLSCVYWYHYTGVLSRVVPSPADEILTHALHKEEAGRVQP